MALQNRGNFADGRTTRPGPGIWREWSGIRSAVVLGGYAFRCRGPLRWAQVHARAHPVWSRQTLGQLMGSSPGSPRSRSTGIGNGRSIRGGTREVLCGADSIAVASGVGVGRGRVGALCFWLPFPPLATTGIAAASGKPLTTWHREALAPSCPRGGVAQEFYCT